MPRNGGRQVPLGKAQGGGRRVRLEAVDSNGGWCLVPLCGAEL